MYLKQLFTVFKFLVLTPPPRSDTRTQCHYVVVLKSENHLPSMYDPHGLVFIRAMVAIPLHQEFLEPLLALPLINCERLNWSLVSVENNNSGLSDPKAHGVHE